MSYDPNNIFAKILRGELPCEKVYEDEHVLSFMDIMPRADGHVLVIPKHPARNIIDIDATALSAMMPVCRKWRKPCIRACRRKGLPCNSFRKVRVDRWFFICISTFCPVGRALNYVPIPAKWKAKRCYRPMLKKSGPPFKGIKKLS